MQAWHQKHLFEPDYPMHLYISSNLEFPPHWHDEIEVLYVSDGELALGVNQEVHTLARRDIFLINSGDIHYFLQGEQKNRVVIVQFSLTLFDGFPSIMGDRRFASPLISAQSSSLSRLHHCIEEHIQGMVREYSERQEGYLLALKARLYDLLVTLLRTAPLEAYPIYQRKKQLDRLDRLKQVIRFVEENYTLDIDLKDVSNVANFSVYHFTRFFKEATGMTFGRYLNHVRLKKAEQYLLTTGEPVTEVAFRVGYNSIKTFNRVFKEHKGCSPSSFRKGLSRQRGVPFSES